jgi:hypothetical protein
VVHFGMAFSDGANVPTAKEFVHFLVSEGWLMHYLNFSSERMMPSIRELLDQPFWLDPSDPHRMRSAMQILTRPHHLSFEVLDNEWRGRVARLVEIG